MSYFTGGFYFLNLSPLSCFSFPSKCCIQQFPKCCCFNLPVYLLGFTYGQWKKQNKRASKSSHSKPWALFKPIKPSITDITNVSL